MDTDHGGTSPSQHESAAEIARKKVLAVYSSTLESLKKSTQQSNNGHFQSRNGSQYVTPPVPGSMYYNDELGSNQAGNDYEQVEFEATDNNERIAPQEYMRPYSAESPVHENIQGYQATDATSALKDVPINQTNINEEWKKYHSAWQNYYQNYYSDYYSKAAQSYLATEKLKSERIADGTVQKKRRFRRLMPLLAGLMVVGLFLFLQYNRLIFAPIMAYVSPDNGKATSSIEAVDPTITQAVSPEPRLIIPKLNIDVPVAFGIATGDVMEAMNHGVAQFAIPGANAMPGQIGNLVISGHSAGDIYSSNPYKFIFSGLERLENGDLIYVNYNSIRYTYRMTKSEVVEPNNVAALIYVTDKPMLTLITCTPLGTSRFRLLITAEQISPAYESNGEQPTIPENPDLDDSTQMPANEPSFFENIWGSIFGG